MIGRLSSLLCAAAALAGVIGSAADVGPAVHAFPPPGSRPLPFEYDIYTFRGPAGSTAVVTSYAVEAGRLDTQRLDDGVRYRFSVSLVLADTVLRSVSGTHDTVSVELPRPMPDDHLLYTHVQVLTRPSTSIRQRVIMNDATSPGIGQLYSEHFTIPDYSGTDLMISDVALGEPDVPSGWQRGDVTLALLPTTLFPTSAFDVYYEIYNLPAGHRYSTQIGIEQVHDGATAGDEPGIRLSFAGRSESRADGTLPEMRRVDTSLARGSYVMTVTITDLVTGETASRSRPFEVRGGRRGTTLVPALPERVAHD